MESHLFQESLPAQVLYLLEPLPGGRQAGPHSRLQLRERLLPRLRGQQGRLREARCE